METLLLVTYKASLTAKVFYYINLAFIIFFFIMYLNQHLHTLVTLFTKKKTFKEAKTNHTFAFLIAARNEEGVIGNLIDSIKQMDYPQDKIKIFVCCDNCTDSTKELALKHGAVAFERNDQVHVGKSYALDYSFKKILAQEENQDIEAFLIMDSDNLVSKNYLKEMNKTFDSGIEVSTSFRQSKNYDSSWISACSSLTFYRECVIVHHSRQQLGLGTYVSGTGFFVSRRIIEELGSWNFNTLTEDIEFSIWCATHDILISYNENAIFYDEQPETLEIANKQRLRWCKGTLQCCYKYEWPLIKGMFKGHKKLTCFGLLIHVTPLPMATLTWLVTYSFLNFVFFMVGLENGDYLVHELYTNILGFIGFIILVSIIHATVSIIRNRQYMKEYSLGSKIKGILLFPLFISMYLNLGFKALFMKVVKWEKIPHTNHTKFEKLEN